MKKILYVLLVILVVTVLSLPIGCKRKTSDTGTEEEQKNDVIYTTEYGQVVISEKDMTVYVGDSVSLSYSVLPKNVAVRWYSSDEKVATVENGVVTAVSTGTTKIFAAASGYAEDYCTVKVNAKNVAAYSVNLNAEKIKLFSGDGYNLEATVRRGTEKISPDNLIWSSSDSSVAKISDDGKITAVSRGKATVYAKYPISKTEFASAEAEVEVVNYYMLSVSCNDSYALGDKFDVYPSLKDKNGQTVEADKSDFRFFSSSDRIIKYSDGKFVATACGTADICVEYEGFVESKQVRVDGLDPNKFTVVSGRENTCVESVKNKGFVYHGDSGANEENCVALGKDDWMYFLQLAEDKGFTKVILTVYAVYGAASVDPFESVEPVFAFNGQKYISSDDVSQDEPLICVRSIEECKETDMLLLGMHGGGKYEFTLSFQ